MKNEKIVINRDNTLYPGHVYAVVNSETGEPIASGTYKGFYSGMTEYINVFENFESGEVTEVTDSVLANIAIVYELISTTEHAAMPMAV